MHKEKNRKKPFLEIKNAVINDQDDDSSKALGVWGTLYP